MDTRDPLFGTALRRDPVVCALCGDTWDERVTDGPVEEPPLSLCPACLLTTSHGHDLLEAVGQRDPGED